ncbi:BspA family leucine-rich repeat surface protein [Lacinutrix jangbogonensis]|uniref:BspA family leucine-rich repeat surface protein n=1 Tax=Lacinutrix jangbogonensis TaxID=1469557 RepID=UPI00138DF2B5|nr:BspA family leucine-rich repeat surface protein [Lacinutrix jangbogonensis]
MKNKLLIVLAILVSHIAFSQCMVEEVSLTERINKASIIIEGEVISKQGFWDAKRQNIYTVNTIQPFKNFKGVLFNNATVDIITMGGTVGLNRLDVSNALKLNIGDIGLFVLKNSPVSLTQRGNFLTTVEGAQGFINYDTSDGSANDGFKRYPSVEQQLYANIESKVGKNLTVLKSVNLFQNNNESQADVITGFGPTTINAGVSDVFNIIGTGFGSSQGTVQFRDSNTGGATWVSALDSDIISWNNTFIRVKVISSASTGQFRVKKSNNVNITSSNSQILTVNWAHLNTEYELVPGTPNSYEINLRAKDANGGYQFKFAPNFSATNAQASFNRALATWNCGSGVNFESSGNTSVNAVASDNTNTVMYNTSAQIIAGGGSASNLATAFSWYSGCFVGNSVEWYVKEIDIVVNSDISWYYGFGDPGDPNKFSFETVALHELGHAQQLGHVGQQNDVMYYALNTGESLTTLTPETLNGASYVMNKSTTTSVCGEPVMTTYAGSICCNNPDIASQPSDVFECVGESASFSVTSNYGTSFQWQINDGGWTNISTNNSSYSNSNTHELTIPVIVGSMNNSEYRCVVTNSCATSVISSPKSLTLEPLPTATLSATAETACENNDGTITFTFPDSLDRGGIEFSINGGASYPYHYDDDIGSATITGITPATYSVFTRYGDDSCVNEVGDITVNENNTPLASVSSSTTSDCINNNGSVTLTWTPTINRTQIEFSIDGGNTYPYLVNNSNGSKTLFNLSPGLKDLWVRWGNDECPVDMEDVTIINSNCNFSNGFKTTWKTNNPGASGNNSITIPIASSGVYNYHVNWGDGQTDYNVTASITHTYASAGTYTVEIIGDFPQIYFNNSGDKEKILSVEKWGSTNWTSMFRAFYGCSNLVVNANDNPDLTGVTSLAGMFWNASSFNQDISTWNVSGITNMGYLFNGATAFNKDISGWNVSGVENMSYMFRSASNFNQNISNWNVSDVLNMSSMFRSANAFDQDLGSWDISSIANMASMFTNVTLSSSNYDNTLIGWNTLSGAETTIPTGITFSGGNSNFCIGEDARTNLDTTHNWTITDGGKDCSSAFITTWKTDNPGVSNANSITIPTNGVDPYNYNVNWGDGATNSNVTNAITHAYATSGTYTVKITGDFPQIHFNSSGDPEKLLSVAQWGSQVWESMENSFSGCTNMVINASDNPDLSEVTSFFRVFRGAEAMNQDISGWNVSTVTSFSQAFYGATTFNQDISTWDVSEAMAMNQMFREAVDFNQNIGGWNVSKVESMNQMLRGAVDFDQNLGDWDISSMLSMTSMFLDMAMSLTNYDNTLIGWNTLSGIEIAIPTGITFSGGNSNFCLGEAARTNLDTTHSWTITDGGKDCSSAFITTWKTDNEGVTNDNSIRILTNGVDSYNFNINWGDGTNNSNVTGTITHTYATAGNYTVTINGDFPLFWFGNTGDKEKLLSVDQWGDQVWKSMQGSFYGCTNMVINATDSPDLSEVTSFINIFRGATVMNQDISTWDVGNVESMTAAFFGATAFNKDLSTWDVSNVLNMNNMFANATVFDHNLGDWDISSVSSMANMFNNAALSLSNYDNTLIGWNTLSGSETAIPTGVTFSGGNSKYCSGEAARTNLDTTHNWTITDDGKVIDCLPFISTWKTNNTGQTNNNSIRIPKLTSSSYVYNYIVDWGDGQTDTNVTGSRVHTYDLPGTYIVKIYGDYPHMRFANTGDKLKILSIEQWGNQQWASMERSFEGCNNLVISATDNPDLSQATSFYRIFKEATSMNQDISGWNVSTITNMVSTFYGATAFNQDISTWNVSNVDDMGGMFFDAIAFNQDISGWIVSKVTRMDSMFKNAFAFNQDIDNWDVSDVLGMVSMFENAGSFDQDLGSWDISSIEPNGMATMFAGVLLSPTNYDNTLIGWNTLSSSEIKVPTFTSFDGGNSRYCNSAIEHASLNTNYFWSITDGGLDCSRPFISTWKTNNLGPTNNTQITIPVSSSETYNYTVYWGDGTSNANVTAGMTHTYANAGTYTVKIYGDFPHIRFAFAGDRRKILSIEQWGSQAWLSMADSFDGCLNLVVNAADNPDLSQATSLSSIFRDATAMNQDISGWDVSTITNMEKAFWGATAFNQDLSTWDVSAVTDMSEMFRSANSFDQDLGAWDISSIAPSGMADMFTQTTLSTANYDNTLIGWSTVTGQELRVPSFTDFNGGNSKFCAGKDARDILNSPLYSWTITDAGSNCAEVAIKVVLQGAALNPNTGEESLMRDDLRVNNLLPTTSPYTDALVADLTVFDAGGTSGLEPINNDIVDWVFVEFRDATNSSITTASQSALLQRDGDVVAIDGVSDLDLNFATGNYYVVVKHRNHLGVMTQNAVTLDASKILLDFTDIIGVNNQFTYGSNAQAIIVGSPNKLALWSGNTNGDQYVQYTGATPDVPNILSTVLNNPGNFLNFPTYSFSEYNTNDVDMNGSIQYSGASPDSPFILQNTLSHPGNFLNFSTYRIQEQLPEN